MVGKVFDVSNKQTIIHFNTQSDPKNLQPLQKIMFPLNIYISKLATIKT
jgi:hypothetical protein